MRKTLSSLLLCIYLCASCTVALPVVRDLIAHIFWHEHHLKTVHYGVEEHAHVAVEMAQLLQLPQGHQAVFSGNEGHGIALSAHLFQATTLWLAPAVVSQKAIFPAVRFYLLPPVKIAIFRPPEGA